MFGRRWTLFRLCGFPISLNASWLVILALLTLSIGSEFPALMHQYFGASAPNLQPVVYWVMGLLAALAFFGCILLHELGHAIVGRAKGMPIRGITLFLFGGVAELADEPASASTEFLMAIAGPLVSVVLGVVFGLLAWIGYHGHWSPPLVLILGYLAAINLIVLVFNLIPAFPLNGGRVLRSILWGATGDLRRATRWAALGGHLFAWILIAWGVLQFFTGNWLGGIWMGLIGMFLNSAAGSSYQQVLMRSALQGEPVSKFMNGSPIVVPPSLDLGHFVDNYVYHFHRKMFPVGDAEHIEGFITTQMLADIPRSQWQQRTVGQLMNRDVGPIAIRSDADAATALAQMQKTGASLLLVMDGNRLVGVLSLKDLLRFLSLKIELEGHDNGVYTRRGCEKWGQAPHEHGFLRGFLHRVRSQSPFFHRPAGCSDALAKRGLVVVTEGAQQFSILFEAPQLFFHTIRFVGFRGRSNRRFIRSAEIASGVRAAGKGLERCGVPADAEARADARKHCAGISHKVLVADDGGLAHRGDERQIAAQEPLG